MTNQLISRIYIENTKVAIYSTDVDSYFTAQKPPLLRKRSYDIDSDNSRTDD